MLRALFKRKKEKERKGIKITYIKDPGYLPFKEFDFSEYEIHRVFSYHEQTVWQMKFLQEVISINASFNVVLIPNVFNPSQIVEDRLEQEETLSENMRGYLSYISERIPDQSITYTYVYVVIKQVDSQHVASELVKRGITLSIIHPEKARLITSASSQ